MERNRFRLVSSGGVPFRFPGNDRNEKRNDPHFHVKPSRPHTCPDLKDVVPGAQVRLAERRHGPLPPARSLAEPAMSPLLEQALVAAHLMSAAAWFGALVYRAFFVDPKAVRFFGWPGDYEQFALHQAHGMRY